MERMKKETSARSPPEFLGRVFPSMCRRFCSQWIQRSHGWSCTPERKAGALPAIYSTGKRQEYSLAEMKEGTTVWSRSQRHLRGEMMQKEDTYMTGRGIPLSKRLKRDRLQRTFYKGMQPRYGLLTSGLKMGLNVTGGSNVRRMNISAAKPDGTPALLWDFLQNSVFIRFVRAANIWMEDAVDSRNLPYSALVLRKPWSRRNFSCTRQCIWQTIRRIGGEPFKSGQARVYSGICLRSKKQTEYRASGPGKSTAKRCLPDTGMTLATLKNAERYKTIEA